MNNEISKNNISEINEKLALYHCPRYEELPKIDLYMDQLLVFLDEYLSPFQIPGEESAITAAMVNNYVKQKVIMPPKNKKYSKKHIMYLMVVGILKNVLSISDIAALIEMQIGLFSLGKCFNFFAIELENALNVTFGTRDFAEANSVRERNPLSKLVRSALLSFANKVYVKQNIYFSKEEKDNTVL